MSVSGLERGQDPGIPEFVRRVNKYGMELGDALDNAVLIERQLGPLTNPRLSEITIGRIVSARERLADQVELARKSGNSIRKSLAEEAVMEYAAIFDPQAKVALGIPPTSAPQVNP